jgi:hypothetical protein
LSRHWPLTTIFLASAIPVVFGSAAVFAMGRTQIVADAERRKETDPHVSEQPG